MAKRTAEDLVKILGIKAREIEAVESTDDGDVVTDKDGHRLIVLNDDSVAWYGYGDKPPNYGLPVFNPATKAVEKVAPPPKPKTTK